MMRHFFLRKPVILVTSMLAAALVVVALWVSFSPAKSLPELDAVPAADVGVSISGVSSDNGALVGGEQVTLTGTDLSAITAVMFDRVRAAELRHIDDHTITVSVPPVAGYIPSTVDIGVKLNGQKATNTTALKYSYETQTDVDRQMQYLFAHWSNYNAAEYGDLNDIGGDCANFVSQSLIARGWTMTDEWYSYDSGSSWGDAWGYVPDLDDWLRSHPETGATELSFQQRDLVKVGDLVVFDWDNDGSLDHVQVVSSVKVVNGVTKIAMVGHNTDSDYRDFDATIAIDHPGATGHFWSIP